MLSRHLSQVSPGATQGLRKNIQQWEQQEQSPEHGLLKQETQVVGAEQVSGWVVGRPDSASLADWGEGSELHSHDCDGNPLEVSS